MKKFFIKKVLIIGGTGFIGFHVAKYCKKKNFIVHIISRKKPKINRRLKNVKYFKADLSNKKELKKVIRKNTNYDFVINLGGEVQHYNKNKVKKSHFIGVKNLSEILLNKNIKKFIQIGSSLEYGHNKSPHKENMKCKPLSSYGIAKYNATKHLLNLNKKFAFPVIILRPYQVYGPNQDDNRFIPFVIKNCINDKNFPCSSGIQYRDFLFILDFVKAVHKCFLSTKKANGEIFNIGYGKPKNLKKIILNITHHIKKGKPSFGKIKLRKEENKITYPNISKSYKILNWKPKISFVAGLNRTIQFYKLEEKQ